MSDPHDALQIDPEARRTALERCYDQIRQWGVALPPSEPLVMDFGLAEFERNGLYEFWIANEEQAGYCGKYMFVLDGQMCPRHCHQVKHETFFVVRGVLDVTLDERRLTLTEGQTLAIAPGRMHSFQGKGPVLMLELSMPCDARDNFFENPRIMEWLRRNLDAPAVSI